MFKYLLALVIVVAGFKSFYAYQDYLTSSPSTVQSTEYQFQVVFPSKHQQQERTVDLGDLGKVKLTSFSVRSPKLKCMVSVADYFGDEHMSGDLYDLIESSRSKLLKNFKGNLEQGEFIENGDVTGYEFNMTLADNTFLRSQVYSHLDNVYNLLCQFDNETKYENLVDDFIYSFTFT